MYRSIGEVIVFPGILYIYILYTTEKRKGHLAGYLLTKEASKGEISKKKTTAPKIQKTAARLSTRQTAIAHQSVL